MMGTTLRDEELFIQTQNQEEMAVEGDDVYLELAKAITVRKCRIVQKKEKLKASINEIKKLKETFQSKVNEKKSNMNELKEVTNQKNIRVQNIKNAQESRATFETTLCDLNNKASFEMAETKRKKNEFDAAIQKAYDTWESYKVEYENFPSAKKLRKKETAKKKVGIEIKQIKMDIEDFQEKKNLKRQIAERRFHLSVVKLAEQYVINQNKFEEQRKLQRKIMETEKLIVDIKSGKMTKHQLELSKQSEEPGSSKELHVVRSSPGAVQFDTPMAELQVISPPPSVTPEESFEGRKLFDWNSLLNSSGSFSFHKKPEDKSVKPMPKTSVSKQTLPNTISTLQTVTQKDKTSYQGKKIGPSLNFSNLLKNLPSSQRKSEVNDEVNKRRYENKIDNKLNKEECPQIKRACNVMPRITECPDKGLTESTNTIVREKSTQCIKKDQGNEGVFTEGSRNKENKENTNSRISHGSSNVKLYMSSLVGNNKNKPSTTPTKPKPMNQTFMNMISLKTQVTGNQRSASELLKKDVCEPEKTIQTASASNKKTLQCDQQNNLIDEVFLQNSNTGCQNQQFEDVPVLLELGSPAPDLIPVETNSQPQESISQEYTSENFNLSGGSDFLSPSSACVDESVKLVYQRLAAQAPIQEEYPRQSVLSTRKPPPEDTTVRSQYFASVPSSDPQSLNTPPKAPEGGYQPHIVQPYSPPPIGMGFDNGQQMSTIPSPPPGNLGVFGGSGSVSNTSTTFSFMAADSTNKSNSTFFNFL